MRRMVTRTAIALVIGVGLSGCPQNARSNPPMNAGFDKALASFRDFAAAQMKVAPKKVNVGPPAEGVANIWKIPTATGDLVGKIGGAWAFEAGSDGKPDVRGWATPDGTPITMKDNLGRLFEEAGAWTSSPRATPDEIAARLAWSLGMGSAVDAERAAPSLKMNGDGTGTFEFHRAFRPPGPGTKIFVQRCTVALTADHKARATFSDDLNK